MLETYSNFIFVEQQLTKPDRILKLKVEELGPADEKILNFSEVYQVGEQAEKKQQVDTNNCQSIQVGFPVKGIIIMNSVCDSDEFRNILHMSPRLTLPIQGPHELESFVNNMVDNLDILSTSFAENKHGNRCEILFFPHM